MTAKDDGFGISESDLQHLVDGFQTITDTFNDILKAERERKRKLAAAAAGKTGTPKQQVAGAPLNPNF